MSVHEQASKIYTHVDVPTFQHVHMYTFMYTCNFQRPLVEGDSTIISIAFMFSPIYLRLEDNVPPPPRN